MAELKTELIKTLSGYLLKGSALVVMHDEDWRILNGVDYLDDVLWIPCVIMLDEAKVWGWEAWQLDEDCTQINTARGTFIMNSTFSEVDKLLQSYMNERVVNTLRN